MPIPKRSDICLSLRSIVPEGDTPNPKSWSSAQRILAQVRPIRIEWSYVRDRDQIAAMKKHADVFVASINTVKPSGHAHDFEGAPCIATWMRKFGKPDARRSYICMNNPDDLQERIEQVTELVADGVTDTFQHDDWYGNAQMMRWPASSLNPTACFCEDCMREFAQYMGLDLDYRDYLARRGVRTNKQLFALAARGEAPMWDDFRRFTEATVQRYFRKLRAAMTILLGEEPTLSVNATVDDEHVAILAGLVDYLHGETWDFSPANLHRMACRSRELGLTQVVSLFPDAPADGYHEPGFVGRVNQAIALCYALGMLPLFPWDVYAGDKPRWFGTWEEYGEQYDTIRARPEIVEDFEWSEFDLDANVATVLAQRRDGGKGGVRHVIGPGGAWRIDVS